ncbi:MAG: LPXTG cell wall anchor domain-containing protein, partial [Acidobacteriota bacterium]
GVKVKQSCGEVLKVINNSVAVRLDDTGKIKVFKNISPDIHWIINGKESSIHELSKGMRGCAYRYEQAPEPVVTFIEEHEVVTFVDTPDEFDEPVPVPAPEPAPVVLPHTGSRLPLVGLIGLTLLALAAGIAVIRRF